MSKLLGIAVRDRPKTPMLVRESAFVSRAAGLEGDFRRKPGKRQVTVLSYEQWQLACGELDIALDWTVRRSNLLVSGIVFSKSMVGSQIALGNLVLEITRETDPCSRMDAQYEGLSKALAPDWRGGVCCRVINDGQIRLGMEVLFNA